MPLYPHPARIVFSGSTVSPSGYEPQSVLSPVSRFTPTFGVLQTIMDINEFPLGPGIGAAQLMRDHRESYRNFQIRRRELSNGDIFNEEAPSDPGADW